MMKAVVLHGKSRAEDLVLSSVAIPRVKPGWVLVRVRSFGLNHSEQILRLSEIEAPYIPKPIIPGIECAGEVADPSDSGLHTGQPVVALMGGMGRSFNGSYAEYVLVPRTHLFTIETDLDWEAVAAVPETYYTAWGSLCGALDVNEDDTVLVRGATSSLGYAAVQLAQALGATVIATTHREDKLALLASADRAVLDTGELSRGAGRLRGVTKALELVGPKTLRDTLAAVEPGALVCNTGVLGGIYALDGFDPIKEIPNGVYLTGFYSNAPTQADITTIFGFLQLHHLTPHIGASFPFHDIREACRAQDEGGVNGKIVVRLE